MLPAFEVERYDERPGHGARDLDRLGGGEGERPVADWGTRAAPRLRRAMRTVKRCATSSSLHRTAMTLGVTATPARHGPAQADRGPVIGFALTFTDGPEHLLYLSGDTPSCTTAPTRIFRPE